MDRTNIVGVRPNARPGIDRYDFSEPPPFDRYVSLSIVERDSDDRIHLLAGSFHPPDGDGFGFDLLVRGNTGKPVYLSLSEFDNIPREFKAVLVDPAVDRSYEIGTEASLVLPHPATVEGAGYRLIIGSPEHLSNLGLTLSTMPHTYSLFQNHPNPFNNATIIDFSLPVPGHVYLDVVNVLGRRVAVVLDEELPAGRHTASWDGLDSKGHSAASGVYFYRMEAGRFKESKKMLLLK